jgi:hypothetical protein
LVDESISDYGCSISSPSLPLLPSTEKRQSDLAAAANHAHMHTEQHRFIQAEIDDDN